MRIIGLWSLAFVLTASSGAAFAEDARTFCRSLRASGLVSEFTPPGTIFYRADRQTIATLGGEISRNVQRLYYYVRPSRAQAGQASLLNIKYVFKSAKRNPRSDYVQLWNDSWDHRKNRAYRSGIVNACSTVTVPGYERFHLQGSREYCLSTYFHQRAPSLETLDTDNRRSSFAFGDMVETSEANFIRQLFGLVTPGSAQAGQVVVNRNSLVRSWIKNVKYQREADRCIEIDTEFPDGAESFQLRVTNHVTQSSTYFPTRTWTVSFVR